MGEAGKKKRRTEAFLRKHPTCCYCGGTNPATDRDHVPSRQLFLGRRRPQGLEVPSCRDCNRNASGFEQVAAAFSRIYPDPTTEAELEEVRKLLKSVSRSVPGLLEEMRPQKEKQEQVATVSYLMGLPKDMGAALNASGPILNRCMDLYGTKLGLALHYYHSERIVPTNGGVATMWFSNYDRYSGRFPQRIYDFLGPQDTLRQGEFSVEDQFSYNYAFDDSDTSSAFLATFRQAFAVLSWISEDVSKFDSEFEVLQPGFLLEIPILTR